MIYILLYETRHPPHPNPIERPDKENHQPEATHNSIIEQLCGLLSWFALAFEVMFIGSAFLCLCFVIYLQYQCWYNDTFKCYRDQSTESQRSHFPSTRRL